MKQTDDKHISFYNGMIFSIVVLVFLGILVKVIYLKTAQKDFWTEKKEKWNIQERPYDAIRGNIYAIDLDSNEKLLLATSERIYDVYIDLGQNKEIVQGKKKLVWAVDDKVYKKNIKSVCNKLAQMFPNPKVDADSLRRYFDANRAKERRYVLVQKGVSESQLEELKRMPIFGHSKKVRVNKDGKQVVETHYSLSNATYAEVKYKRVHPYGELARRTIGINVTTDGCQNCFDGIDGFYERSLAGVHGVRLERRIRPGLWVPIDMDQSIKVSDGFDVITTLDVTLQELAEDALMKCLDSNQADNGTVILMEAETGHIKALANLTKQSDGSYRETENIGASARYEPGSTFKMVTAMMLLDKGYVDTSAMVPTGKMRFSSSQTKDIVDVGSVNHGDVSFTRALEMSSNVGISSLVYNIYGQNKTSREKFISDLKEYFIYDSLGYDLQLHEPKPYIRNTTSLDDILRLSFGYVTAMTPLQMLTFYNGIANGGKVMKPMFVSEIQHNGEPVETFKPVVLKEKMCQESTLFKIQDILKRVVQYGTGKRLRSAPYGIAGKSGTAETNYTTSEGYRKHRASFVGYFPADAPKYSCIVVISNPNKGPSHGGDLAAPVFRELSDRVVGSGLASYSTKQTDAKKVQPIMTYGHAGQYKSLCRNLGFHLADFSCKWIKTSLQDGIFHSVSVIEKENIMPDVKGLTSRDAVYMLESMGLQVKINGYGKVVEQSIPKNSTVERGQRVELKMTSQREKEEKLQAEQQSKTETQAKQKQDKPDSAKKQ